MSFTVLIVAAIVVLILYTFSDRIYRFYLFYRDISKINGPEFAIPFYGFGLKLMSLQKEEQLEWMRNLANQYKDGLLRVWLGFGASVHMHKPEHIEIMLRSHTELKKSEAYTYMVPWLGRGLITSNGGDQWFHHRKLLTPGFHFSILEDFAEVMMEKAAIMNSCIEREIKINGDKPFDVFNLGVRCALDVICETAMGTNVHAQEEIESEYINAVTNITAGAMKRFWWPWMRSDWIFYNSSYGKSYKAAVITAHDLCTRIIKRKLQERQSGERNNEITDKGKKKVFLDLLLEANEKEDNPLTIEEIRDEINTFMFAGHDTTGAVISWALFSIGSDPEIQRKVHEELDEILGNSDDHATVKKMPRLKYLERVIKEVMRLYPTVTAISRSLQNDLQICEHTVPAGATFVIQIYHLHRDPTVWPDPLRFDPDRFLPENSNGRHPYAYIPFSAGPRNCLGQKYAMLEAKLVVAQVLRKFSVKSIESHSTIKIYSDIILKPLDGIFVTMSKRSTAVK